MLVGRTQIAQEAQPARALEYTRSRGPVQAVVITRISITKQREMAAKGLKLKGPKFLASKGHKGS